MKSLIIDTDIGSDVDDALAIALALEKNVHVPLITTVHGDTVLRAKIAKTFTKELGFDIPVYAGEKSPIKQKQIFTTGFEDESYPTYQHDGNNAVDKIIETLHKSTEPIAIAALGPLTNIARAIQKDKSIISKIKIIYAMGAAHERENNMFPNFRSHNFKVDPEAVDIVFASKVPLIITTTTVSKEHALTMSDFEKLAMSKNRAFIYLYDAAKKGLGHIGYESAHLYDPLTIYHHIDKNITDRNSYGHIEVSKKSRNDFKGIVFNSLDTLAKGINHERTTSEKKKCI